MEAFALCYETERCALNGYADLGLSSSPLDAPPVRQSRPPPHTRRQSRPSVTDKIFGYKSKRRLGETEAAILLLMNEAGLLELEFAARVLEPLWQAGSAGGNTCEMNGPSLKQMPRARQKTKFDYNNDHLRLLDLLRGSIICKTFDDVLAVFRRLHKLEVDGILKIVRVKNRFKDGSLDGSGYCDANINIELLPCDSANTFKHGHICEIQIHLQSFYELKCGSHAIYKIVRTLQLEGALLEIPDVTAISTVTRCACSVLLMLAIFIGLLSSTFYRYYNWTGEAPWCTKAGELLPNVHTAALIFPFLLISYMSAARLLRALHSRQRLLATLLQLLCAVFVVAFGITLEPPF